MANFFLALRLFRLPLTLVVLIYFVVVVTVLVLFNLKQSYHHQLQMQFVSKQPHISVSFIDDNIEMDQAVQGRYAQHLRSFSDQISSVSPFSKGKAFFVAQGRKEGGDAFFSGYITLIGSDPKSMVYDFYGAKLVGRPPFEIQYTPLEFLQRWQDDSGAVPLVVFNQTLFNSFFPVIASIDRFVLKNKAEHIIDLGAVFEDFDQGSIIYTSLKGSNAILKRHPNHLDGFYLNISDYDQISGVKKLLAKALKGEKVQVNSWLESRQKQLEIFTLYEALSWIVALLLMILALLFIFLFLYYAIVKKSYQLSLLFTLGFSVQRSLKFTLIFLLLGASIIAWILSYHLSVDMVRLLELPEAFLNYRQNIPILLILDFITIFMTLKLIHSAYAMKLKSLI